MTNNIRAIGLSSIEKNTKRKSELLKLVKNDPHKSYFYFDGMDKIAENYYYIGENYGIVAYGKILEDGSFKMTKWHSFVHSLQTNEITDVMFDKIRGNQFVFAEEHKAGNRLEFALTNMCQYYDYMAADKYIPKFNANIAGLSSEGNVIFPVAKNEKTRKIRRKEEKRHNELINLLRKGDEMAETKLMEHSQAIAHNARERLKKEDVLSVFESYFFPYGNREGIFAILGDILDVNEVVNPFTNETVYDLFISATNTKFNVFINKIDLTGVPSAGMRFRGRCQLRGSLDFS